jgi:hypothetical protein
MSNDLIRNHVDKMMKIFTDGVFYDDLVKAKAKYFEMTGVISEEDKDFEARMNAFNDWYLFQNIKDDGYKPFENYIKTEKLDDGLCKSFYNINYSLFQVLKTGNGSTVLEDILHNEKIKLANDHEQIALINGDLFVGRVVHFNSQNYMLRGVTLFPNIILPILKKQSKKIRKLFNNKEEANFLLKLESLNTKSKNYGHIATSKIFVFN